MSHHPKTLSQGKSPHAVVCASETELKLKVKLKPKRYSMSL